MGFRLLPPQYIIVYSLQTCCLMCYILNFSRGLSSTFRPNTNIRCRCKKDASYYTRPSDVLRKFSFINLPVHNLRERSFYNIGRFLRVVQRANVLLSIYSFASIYLLRLLNFGLDLTVSTTSVRSWSSGTKLYLGKKYVLLYGLYAVRFYWN